MKPLFSGYLFVNALPDTLYDVRQIRGVVAVLGHRPDTPTPLPDGQVEAIQLMLAHGRRVAASPEMEIQLGTRVRVITGPLMGVEGVLVSRKGFDRLVVRVDLIGRGVSVEINAEDVEPVEPSK